MEAFPDETQMMKYKLVTLPRGTQVMPLITGVSTIPLPQGGVFSISPKTLNYNGSTIAASETAGYSFTISDVRVCQVGTGFVATGVDNAASTALNTQNENQVITNGTSVSQTVLGTVLSLTGTSNSILFGTGNTLYATLTVIGLDSGARAQVPVNVTRTTT